MCLFFNTFILSMTVRRTFGFHCPNSHAIVLHAPGLTQQKSSPQFIARINQKLMPPGDARRSFDLRNNRIVRAECGGFYHPPCESGADDALDQDGFAVADIAASVMNGQTPTNAGPR